jgi:hypothetical protein
MHCKSIIPRSSLPSGVKPALALFEMRGAAAARPSRTSRKSDRKPTAEHRVDEMAITTALTNVDPQRFYARHGFQPGFIYYGRRDTVAGSQDR